MFSTTESHAGRHWLSSVILIMVLIFLLTPTLQATGSEEKSEDWDVRPAAPAEEEEVQVDDGGDWELGIHGSAANMTQTTASERYGMTYWLAPLSNWVVKHNFNEITAWEEDFKRMSLGGTNNVYADAVDLEYYIGNGSPYGFTFANADHDDATLGYDDCERAWGDQDNEWVALTSSNVLDDSKVHEWAQCFNGSHLILGFKTSAYASSNYWDTQSFWFGHYVRRSHSIGQAWFKACDLSQHSRSVTRVLANELDCFDDQPNLGQVCADSYDTDWWYWSHSCDAEVAISTPVERLAQGMPMLRIAPVGLDGQIPVALLNVFSIPITATVQHGAFLTANDNGREVEADRYSSHFAYYDLNRLWSAAAAEAAYAVDEDSPNYIGNDDARQIADDFLNRTGLMAPGAFFSAVISDSISAALDSAPGAPPEAIATGDSEKPTAWQVIYSRRLVYTPTISAAGVFTEPIEFSLVGPGAKQKVYVPVNSAIMAGSPLEDPILGVLGGWRSVQPQFVVNAAGKLEAVTISMLPTDTVRALYDALGDQVAMADIPLDFKSREILSETVAYYEMAAGQTQGALIPVYQFLVRFTLQDDTTIDEYVQVPVNELYMRPYAAIIAGVPSESVRAGTTLTLTAADASQTLQALGIGDFNFALGNGAPNSYWYEWFIDSPDDANFVGSGRTVTFHVPVGTPGHGSTRTILLQVRDLNSPNDFSSTTSITIKVDPAIFLPLIAGN